MNTTKNSTATATSCTIENLASKADILATEYLFPESGSEMIVDVKVVPTEEDEDEEEHEKKLWDDYEELLDRLSRVRTIYRHLNNKRKLLLHALEFDSMVSLHDGIRKSSVIAVNTTGANVPYYLALGVGEQASSANESTFTGGGLEKSTRRKAQEREMLHVIDELRTKNDEIYELEKELYERAPKN